VKRAARIATLPALLVAGLVVLAGARYWRDVERARDRIEGRSEVAQTPCGPIEYATKGIGPPVLVVHGAGGGFDQGLDFGEALAGKGYLLVAMSRFGYLRTPLPQDASASAQADAHACLLDALGIRRAAIVGVSAGAPSTMQFALRHPERASAMVLAVPAAFVPRQDDAPSVSSSTSTRWLFDTALRSDFLFWAALKVARSTLIEAILATPPSVVQRAAADEQARVDKILTNILPVSARRLGLINDAAVTSSIPRYALERITARTLVLSAADDRFGTFDIGRYTAENIPGARFVGYPDGGHVWVGRHKEAIAEIAAFLATST
jgi:pimeloyl-ACP methyl ester carboxylesterase